MALLQRRLRARREVRGTLRRSCCGSGGGDGGIFTTHGLNQSGSSFIVCYNTVPTIRKKEKKKSSFMIKENSRAAWCGYAPPSVSCAAAAGALITLDPQSKHPPPSFQGLLCNNFIPFLLFITCENGGKVWRAIRETTSPIADGIFWCPHYWDTFWWSQFHQ